MIPCSWWRPDAGRLVPLLATIAVAGALAPGCDKVALLAPQGSFISLNATSLVVPTNGAVEVVAFVIEPAGTAVHNGTLVTFITTVGRIDPPEARTNNGKATVRLLGNGQSGPATVTAFSGDARDSLEILVGGAAAGAVNLTANPRTIPPGGTSEVSALVTDTGGNALAAVAVSFSTDAGTLSASSATTDESGRARVQLSTDRDTTVTARVPGSTTEPATILVRVAAAIAVTLTASPNPVAAHTPTVLTAVATPSAGTNIQRYEWDFTDDGVVDRTTTGPAVSHAYTSSGNKVARVRVFAADGGEGTGLVIVVVESP